METLETSTHYKTTYLHRVTSILEWQQSLAGKCRGLEQSGGMAGERAIFLGLLANVTKNPRKRTSNSEKARPLAAARRMFTNLRGGSPGETFALTQCSSAMSA